jgi:hypothetical protein
VAVTALKTALVAHLQGQRLLLLKHCHCLFQAAPVLQDQRLSAVAELETPLFVQRQA